MLQRTTPLHAGVVDHDVQCSPGFSRSHARAHSRTRGDIKDFHLHRQALGSQICGAWLKFVVAAAVQDDGGPGLRQALGQGQADAGAGAGDQGTTATEIE